MQDWRNYYDDKHITLYAVPIFVSSLKNAWRSACKVQQQQQHHLQNQHERYRGGGPNVRGGFNNQRRGRGNGLGCGGVSGRDSGRGRHNDQKGFDRGDRADFLDDLEKFKHKILNIITTQHVG